MANKTIYILQGHSGSYEDKYQWVVKSYTDKAKAESNKLKAEEFVSQVSTKYNEMWQEYDSEIEPNPYDEFMDIDYGNCWYDIIESTLEDSNE